MSELYIYEDLDEFDDIFGDLDMTMLRSGEKHHVFVYGTLMKGMRNHYRLKDAGAKLLDDDSHIVGDFNMMTRITGGGYPAPIVVPVRSKGFMHGAVIMGELYEVDNATLMLLDSLEGHPEVYERQLFKVSLNECVMDVMMYVYVDTIPRYCNVPTLVPETDVPEFVEITKKRVSYMETGPKTVSYFKWRGL